MKKGIPVETSFAGVVEVESGQAAKFTDLIAYAGSSLDPMKVFMARKVTRAADAIATGSGKVLANVREVPVAAANQAVRLLEQSKVNRLWRPDENGKSRRAAAGMPR